MSLIRRVATFWSGRGVLGRSLIANVSAAIVLALLFSAVYVVHSRSISRRHVSERARTLAALIAAEVALPLWSGDRNQLERAARMALFAEGVLEVRVFDSASRPLARVRPDAVSGSALGYAAVATAPVRSETGPLGRVEVRLAPTGSDGLLPGALARAGGAAILALVAILTVQSVHFRRLLAPLQTLADFANQVGHGDVGSRAPVRRGDEIGQLAQSFNDMLDRLSETTVSRDHVDSIVRSIGEPLIVADRKLHIRTVNAAAVEILGGRPGQLEGMPLEQFMERGPRLARAYYSPRPLRRRAYLFEETLITLDGRRIPALLTCSMLSAPDGSSAGLVFTAHDITARKRSEQALIAAKEAAEESSRAKSSFLANMSHELRTPLNAIINYSEMLIEDAMAAGCCQQASDLERIRNSGKHLLAVINDVLDLSKLDAGRVTVHPEYVRVGPVIADVVANCEALARRNGSVLAVGDSGDLALYSDPLKLTQILINLVSNACKFTTDGEIAIEVRREETSGAIAFDVRDTGAGIAPHDMPKLFQSFTQVDASNARRHGGTGLGLAISQKLAGLMGGAITAVSTVGQGSTFTLSLPEVDRDSGAATAAGGLLVVDSEPRVLALCLEIASRAECRTEFSTSTCDAVVKGRLLRPAVVALNAAMCSELDATAARELLSWGAVPVLYRADGCQEPEFAPASALFKPGVAAAVSGSGWPRVLVLGLQEPGAGRVLQATCSSIPSGTGSLSALMASLEGAGSARAAMTDEVRQ